LSKRVVRAIVLILTDDDEEEEEEEEEEDNHSDDSDAADAKRRSNSMRARVFVQSATVKMTKKLVYLGFWNFFSFRFCGTGKDTLFISREERSSIENARSRFKAHRHKERERERVRAAFVSRRIFQRGGFYKNKTHFYF